MTPRVVTGLQSTDTVLVHCMRRYLQMLRFVGVAVTLSVIPLAAAVSPVAHDGGLQDGRQAAAASTAPGPAQAAQAPPAADAPASPTIEFIATIEQLVNASNTDTLRTLFGPLMPDAEVTAAIADLAIPNARQTTFRERDRAPIPGIESSGYRVVVESFSETANAGRIATIRFDLRRFDNLPGAPWRIVAFDRLTLVDGLYKLSLDESTQYSIDNLRLTGEDVEIAVDRGEAFVAMTPDGITALVILGNGTMTFSPRPEAEQVQVKLFSGKSTLVAPFSVAWIRLNPQDVRDRVNANALVPGPVDRQQFEKARAVFTEEVSRSFSLDLSDLSRDTWTLIPGFGDLLTTVRTRKYGELTYTHSNNEAEDISLFDRQARRNIAVYASQRRLASRGRGYDEDMLADYDVLDYSVDATYTPLREWMEGRATMTVRVRSYVLSTFTVKLAESLVVRSVVGDRAGRLLALRVRGQNNLLVSLPTPLSQGELITLTITYAGRLQSLPPDREVALAGEPQDAGVLFPDAPVLTPEPRWVFTNRTDWYPQAPVTDYATATMRLTVPSTYQVMASGEPAGTPTVKAGTGPRDAGVTTYEFAARQPVRYLAWVVSKLAPSTSATVELPPAPPATSPASEPATGPEVSPQRGLVLGGFGEARPVPQGAFYSTLDLSVVANPRQVSRGRALAELSRQIFEVYGALVDDLPYPSFALTLVDHELPGGHSPAYFALLHQPLPTSPYLWRNDPVYFDEFPLFFLAHELAHQYWGQAVGWKSYHEQWISEGFAQYFALLYAERRGGPDLLESVLGKMRRSALEYTGQGPIWLGYRLGHIRNESRVFRAVIYNKSAVVLHMLRGLMGDERFFEALKALYRASRFRKIGTDDVRRAFEQAAGQSLERFFERWVYEFGIPRAAWRVESGQTQSVVVVDQDGDLVYDFPVTVSYTDVQGQRQTAIIPVNAEQVRFPLPGGGPARDVRVEHGGSLVRLSRTR